MTPLVSVVIPMYNEEENLPTLVQAIEKSLDGALHSWELLLVNDGSSDGTLPSALRIAQQNPRVRVASYQPNRGRGKALRVGFQEARGKYLVTLDADLSYHPNQIPLLIRTLEEDPELDIVVGSPYCPGGKAVGVPWDRLLISRLGNWFLRSVFSQPLTATTGIFRAYRREVLPVLPLESNGKEIHLEILSKALAAGFRVKEVPATLTYRKKGRSKFRFRRTAASHLIFSVHERPILLFGFLGFVLILLGLIAGGYVSWLRFAHQLNPGRPLMTVVVLLTIGGIQILSFGFIAAQIQRLRREMYRLHRSHRDFLSSS